MTEKTFYSGASGFFRVRSIHGTCCRRRRGTEHCAADGNARRGASIAHSAARHSALNVIGLVTVAPDGHFPHTVVSGSMM